MITGIAGQTGRWIALQMTQIDPRDNQAGQRLSISIIVAECWHYSYNRLCDMKQANNKPLVAVRQESRATQLQCECLPTTPALVLV
jgi:hypothetical protein